MLIIDGLDVHYGTGQVLFGIGFRVAPGEVVTLMGRNGMGKTTTVHAITGIVRATGGSVRFHGRELTRLPSFRIARLGIGLVPEGRQVFPNLTVHENLMATAANRRGQSSPWTTARIYRMFPELAARRNASGTLLSGGEQQMLTIGRALMTNPELLILDEASEGLAPLVRRKIWSCLTRIREEGLSILVVDKNIADLMKLAQTHIILEKGRVVWSGSSEALADHPDIRNRYLGV
uniref:Amino acid/amide ABC transporter ATP-binding protein 2, HAAT family (TC 3.A.1.4.-) n=1 Tax=Candidatus Kentrum sp. TUN TaxID=2126343 RepID=A0A450ZD18_9GAMM|nr:MAG: amino acid/amide ABC transporter ATP-binding protein 2, HAAT family (TC 3.A.1.4.-) [Candidatus Kentron sp. TUN]VFK51669.1 MAG: amino acid/amide ABC transporter ATP-binding protein 2, HAAT family (TC 3.A.1.4.-) [Candidatus Kentron sp. TUN]VFK55085.1 MAG: amino acid/amide ABC transporter ATP-binding protein 2, HAAT family (TC 3.A.1.4.-) [Candidatus Kentron sp. TUN]